jgi:hypothetical protein
MPANTSSFLLLSRGSLVFSPSKGNSKGKMGKSVGEQLSNTSTQPESTRPPHVMTPLGAMMNEIEAPTWTDMTWRDVPAAKYGCCTAREAEKIHTWMSTIDHSGAKVHS